MKCKNINPACLKYNSCPPSYSTWAFVLSGLNRIAGLFENKSTVYLQRYDRCRPVQKAGVDCYVLKRISN